MTISTYERIWDRSTYRHIYKVNGKAVNVEGLDYEDAVLKVLAECGMDAEQAKDFTRLKSLFGRVSYFNAAEGNWSAETNARNRARAALSEHEVLISEKYPDLTYVVNSLRKGELM